VVKESNVNDLKEIINQTPENNRKDILAWMTLTVLSLIDKPEEMKLLSSFENSKVVIKLRVHSTDIGKVIGKKGRTARSIRVLLCAMSMKYKQKFELDIVQEKNNESNQTIL
jgi:uncharacterized protein